VTNVADSVYVIANNWMTYKLFVAHDLRGGVGNIVMVE
jgi:hypothetical protein